MINCKTTRRMLELSHGRFLERLKYYAMTKRVRGAGGLHHDDVREGAWGAAAAKLPKCGLQNRQVGGAKVFSCADPDCGYRMERDLHGSRNICISTVARMRHTTASVA